MNENLKKRIITASILVPAVIGIIFIGNAYLSAAAIALCSFLGAMEWANLSHYVQRYLYAMLVIVLTGIAYLYYPYALLIIAVVLWLFAGLSLANANWRLIWQNKWLNRLSGLVILSSFALSLMQFSSRDFFYLLAIVASADTSAYFSGKAWGKSKLAPLISPGKTWVGVSGALCSSIIIAFIANRFLGYEQNYLLLSPLLVISSIYGDLFTSWLKRLRCIKDSGNLLPGHGGILDRVDGLLSSSVVFALWQIIIYSNKIT